MPVAPSRPRSILRLVARTLVITAAALIALALIRWQATLNWAGNYLVCSDPLEHADLIVVMGGDFWGPRVIKAADLGMQGLAPVVLISGPPYRDQPEGNLAVEFLVKQGYERGLFAVFPHHESSTLGEVLVLGGELARRRARRVIVVTSAYHSRRCAILFRLFYPDIRFVLAPAPDSHYRADGWWRDPSSRHFFFSECAKILGSILFGYPAERIAQWRAHTL
ncbi:MAG TPA: YdcF family protein [Bryobacteraceae bacterium]|nr:YdcF family protein [Bryobacteraceae bacterium]